MNLRCLIYPLALCLIPLSGLAQDNAAPTEAKKPVPVEKKKPVIVSKKGDEASKLINAWFVEGKAAGLEGVFYDNRDRTHSSLGITSYPQMEPIVYTEEELAKRSDWGGANRIVKGRIIIGNSSTASPANSAGSHQRMFYLNPRGMVFLYLQYRTNALYFYPEHRDHDTGTNGPDGYGDLYPANSPYLISSQGSSGTDRVFMHAFVKTIAAFQPKTRDALVANGILMPTLQSIFRHTYQAVEKPEDYFTGKAHPSVFEGTLIDEVAMVKRAQAMTPEMVPPLVQLEVLEDVAAVVPKRDFFEMPQVTSEAIADSPCSIARVFRGGAYKRTMRLSARKSADLKKRDLKFRWVILRGDPDLIQIETAGKNDVEATITVAYHPRRPISKDSPMWSNRVDIGVFVEAEGATASAPAFVSFMTLPNEHRTYSDDGKLLEIFYGARNEELGLPEIDHANWDALLLHFDTAEADFGPGIKLVTAVMEKEQVASLRATAEATLENRFRIGALQTKLDTINTALQKVIDETNKVRKKAVADDKKKPTEESKKALTAANKAYSIAKKAKTDGADGAAELKKQIAALRVDVVAELRKNGIPEMVRAALITLRDEPRFFSKNKAEIKAASKNPANPKATGLLAAAQRRLSDVGVVGVVESENPPANERYHLAQFNLDVLSDVIIPELLDRPPGLNYADPRLTLAKSWRDVYRTYEDGSLAGWTRFQKGKKRDYNAVGDLIREVVPVTYLYNPKTKQLDIKEPAKEAAKPKPPVKKKEAAKPKSEPSAKKSSE